MWCNQIFSLIHEDKVRNTIVCDNYEIANQIARSIYGVSSFAIDTTQYPIMIGDSYIDGLFYHDNVEIIRNPTETESISILENKQLETELNVDYRLSLLEIS